MTKKIMTKKKKQLRLSPSSLSNWYYGKCPQAWKFDRSYQVVDGGVNEAMERGSLVHSMLEGKTDPAAVTDNKAITLYQKLNDIRTRLGITITDVEKWQTFPVMENVIWARKIDAMATFPTGEKILIDYKTSGGKWKVVDSKSAFVSPQALGFQGIGYLLPPPDIKDWPTKVIFLVASWAKTPQIFEVDYSDEERDNLLNAITIVKNCVLQDLDVVKVRGYHCFNCNYQEICYESPKYESLYKAKRTYKG